MEIVFNVESQGAINLRSVLDNYVLQPGEVMVDGSTPVIEIINTVYDAQTITDLLSEGTARKTAKAEKAQAIIDNLPSWQTISNAIDNATTVAGLKVIVKKISLIVYWLAKNKKD